MSTLLKRVFSLDFVLVWLLCWIVVVIPVIGTLNTANQTINYLSLYVATYLSLSFTVFLAAECWEEAVREAHRFFRDWALHAIAGATVWYHGYLHGQANLYLGVGVAVYTLYKIIQVLSDSHILGAAIALQVLFPKERVFIPIANLWILWLAAATLVNLFPRPEDMIPLGDALRDMVKRRAVS